MLCGLTHDLRTIFLRQPRPDQAELAWLLLRDPSLHPDFMLGYEVPSLEEYIERVHRAKENEKGILWWICVDGQFAGVVGAYRLGVNEVEGHKTGRLYYAVSPGFRGQGVATASARRAIKYIFETNLATLLLAEVLASNRSSRHILERLGFELSPIIPERYEEGGRSYETCQYLLEPTR
ncbi:MAG: GNAT family N-acetyltransferase [Patescibacteria group bacterium]